jgi:hypothetical protein
MATTTVVGRNGDNDCGGEALIPNVMARANCRRKINPKPRWLGSSSCLFIHLMT